MSITLKRILLPMDFSECSAAAAKYACAMAKAFDAELHLLHILEMRTNSTPEFIMGLAIPSEVPESRIAALQRLETAIDPQELEGRRIVCAVTDGPTEEGILHYAHDHHVDLIVMGTHGRTGLDRLIMGSAATATLNKAPCPVLAVRPQAVA